MSSPVYSGVMLRKQIYMDESLDRRVRKAARAQRRSAASLIREAVAAHLERIGPPAGDPLLEIIGLYRGGPKDASVEHDKYLYGTDD